MHQTASSGSCGGGNKSVQDRQVTIGAFAYKFRTFSLFKEVQNELNHQQSTETNTISNSSLQDMDEMEFSSSDLVKFMAEVNKDLA